MEAFPSEPSGTYVGADKDVTDCSSAGIIGARAAEYSRIPPLSILLLHLLLVKRLVAVTYSG